MPFFPSGDNLKSSSGIFKGFPQKCLCISNWVAHSNTDKFSGGEKKKEKNHKHQQRERNTQIKFTSACKHS